MAGCRGASAHGLPITGINPGINEVNVSCVACFENKVYKKQYFSLVTMWFLINPERKTLQNFDMENISQKFVSHCT